jgi:pyruvate formate lyase activating enzyme
MEPDEVVEVVMKDADYYQNSGGGLTISGGEPLLQKEFVKTVFEKTHALGFHNALDTAANINWTEIEDVLPSVDLVLLDLKVMDPKIHKKFTGVSNTRILQNAGRLAQQAVDLIVRIPLIPGVNDTKDNMYQTAIFLEGFPRLLYVELLPYHDLGVEKYTSLGQKGERGMFDILSKEKIHTLPQCFNTYNIHVKVDS